MKKYWKLIAGIAAFVIVILGVKVLYDNLSAEYGPESQMVTNGAVGETTTAAKVDSMLGGVFETEAQTTQASEDFVPAMDFTVVNEAGENVTLSSLFGKPIVINFWASWCSPCKAELPDFQAAYEKYGDEVQFMMVNMTDGARETVDVAKEYMASAGYTFPLYFDTTQEAAYTYAVYSIPMTFFIDANGNIAAYAQSMIDMELIEQGISMIR